MVSEQVKTSQTWKQAAYTVAFFSLFFTNVYALDMTLLDLQTPKAQLSTNYHCGNNARTYTHSGQGTREALVSQCVSKERQIYIDAAYPYGKGQDCTLTSSATYDGPVATLVVSHACPSYPSQRTFQITPSIIQDIIVQTCPPDDYPHHTGSTSQTGVPMCFNPKEAEILQDAENEANKAENECKSLVLDSGNNTDYLLCHTSRSGSKSCNIQKVTTDGGGSYYKGTSASNGGCYTSDNQPYDDSGTGNEKDDCLYSNGTNYCQANRAKHCSTTAGTEICDDGCIDDGTNLFCDTSRHPDVGEGDSNYFDDNGTCSIISASSTKGFCEDNGGLWDKTQDFQETTCPSGAGSCSIPTAGLCGSCFDSGGVWTPDPTAPLTPESIGIETAALTQTGNEKLTQIEQGQRKTSEATQSTIKSGNSKIVQAINSLGEKLGQPAAEEENNSFTTTTQNPDKSAFKSMFDINAQTAVKSRIVTAQTEFDAKLRSIALEAKSLFTVTIPTSVGYQARNIQTTWGSIDASLARHSDFFKLLAGPIMLLCSLVAAFALLKK